MKAKDIMTSEVIAVEKTASVRDVADKMAEADVGSVIVNDSEQLVGIITDRDLAIRALTGNQNPDRLSCADVMSTHVITASKDTDMEDVINLMSEHQIKRIPITEKKEVVGMISLRDISQTIEWDEEAGEVLNRITD